MIGGAGADTFTFAAQNGHDTVNFEQGLDKIDLTALSANSFGDLNIEVAGSNSIIHFDANNSPTVAGINSLAAGDFWFA